MELQLSVQLAWSIEVLSQVISGLFVVLGF